MAKKKAMNISRITRYAFGLVLCLLLFGGIILIAFHVLPLGLPWHLFLLTFLIFASPLIFVMVYLAFWTVIPITGGMPAKGLRQLSVVYGLGVAYVVYLALLTFIFETFTPTIPLFYRGIFLPQLVILITLLILIRTRLKPRFERFLRRAFGESLDN